MWLVRVISLQIYCLQDKRTRVQIVNFMKMFNSPEAQDEIQAYRHNTLIKV
jgi:hypothetical protein